MTYTQHQIVVLSLKQVYNGFEDKDLAWVYGHELQSTSTAYGFLGSNGGRRCRELAKEGLIERRERNGEVQYRYIPKEVREAPKTPQQIEEEKLKQLSLASS